MLTAQTLGGPQHPSLIVLPQPLLGGNLANRDSQLGLEADGRVTRVTFAVNLFGETAVSQSPLSSKLAALKRERFAPDTAGDRILRSLAAVGAPQPTQLSAAEWKLVAQADIEDQF